MNIVELTPEFVRRFNEQQRELEEFRHSVGTLELGDTANLRRDNDRLTVEVEQLKTALATGPGDQNEIRELRARLVTLEQDSNTIESVRSKLESAEAALLKVRQERDTSLKDVQTLNTERKNVRELEEEWKTRYAEQEASHQKAIGELKKSKTQASAPQTSAPQTSAPQTSAPQASLPVQRSRHALRAEFQRLKEQLQREEKELAQYDRLVQDCEDEILSQAVDLMTQELEKKRLRGVLAKKEKYGNK